MKKSQVETYRVLKTAEGYLHHDVDEGMYLAEGEANYWFTDDPLMAYDFYGDDDVPKYLGNTSDKPLKTAQDCCDFLNGKLVNIKVTKTIHFEEID